jgi:hypothetical protein
LKECETVAGILFPLISSSALTAMTALAHELLARTSVEDASVLAVYASTTTRQRSLIGVSIGLTAVAVLTVALRMFTRIRITRKFAGDDCASSDEFRPEA